MSKCRVEYGCLYTVLHDRWRHGQSYGLAIAVNTEDGPYMMDTFEISGDCMNHDTSTAIQLICDADNIDTGGMFFRSAEKFYYHNYEKLKLDVNNFPYFDDRKYQLLVDLHTWHELKDRSEVLEYSQSDTIDKIQLYHENDTEYNGIILVRDGAIKDADSVLEHEINHVLNNIIAPNTLCSVDALESILGDAELRSKYSKKLITLAENCVARYNKVNELRKEYLNFLKSMDK